MAATGPEGGVQLVSDPLLEPKPEGWTRFVCFSDTHGLHDKIPSHHMPEADVLMHAGDLTNTGELEQVQSFSAWLDRYPATHKVVIAGNHDVTFHEQYYRRAWRRYHGVRGEPYSCEEVRAALTGCIYLEDESAEVSGYLIYGSPWQPEFCDWAFNVKRGHDARNIWKDIPPSPDILITHGPPKGIGDRCSDGFHAGCEELMTAIHQRIVPVHLAGHIHEAYGAVSDGVTLFVNASTCTLKYRPTNAPIVFDLPPPEELKANVAKAAAARASPAPALASATGKRPADSASASRDDTLAEDSDDLF